MIDPNTRIEARRPSLREDRDGRVLLIWGELGQWLVVDAEAAALVDRFADRPTVDRVFRDRAASTGKSLDVVARETLPVVEALVERGILAPGLAPPTPPADPLRLSNLTFNITNRCNLRCGWCYNWTFAISQMALEK